MTAPGSTAEEVVRRYYEYVDGQDPALFDLFHPSIRYKRPGYPVIDGIVEFREFYRSRRIITEGRHSVEALFHSDRRVAVEGRFTGILRDGSRADLFFSDFFDLIEEAGSVLIASRRTYFDDTRV
ncbi:nuclear transport factor 2 family protein [Streptomyces sp. NPDC127084]|uniref:nuclear transport factor 2 family protein n=1 Tax=Streptomyces sp. NPDC127084 TaxID=3347133 RepID=UPI003669C5B1